MHYMFMHKMDLHERGSIIIVKEKNANIAQISSSAKPCDTGNLMDILG